MFLCFGSVSACLQSSAMEILLGLNTLLHSVRPNQVVSGLLSSYAVAWKMTRFATLYSFCKKKGGRREVKSGPFIVALFRMQSLYIVVLACIVQMVWNYASAEV